MRKLSDLKSDYAIYGSHLAPEKDMPLDIFFIDLNFALETGLPSQVALDIGRVIEDELRLFQPYIQGYGYDGVSWEGRAEAFESIAKLLLRHANFKNGVKV